MSSLLEHLIEQNPWWNQKFNDTTIPREKYLTKIFRYLTTHEILVINGVRRSGKTTLLKQTIAKLLLGGTEKTSILFVTCDHPLIQELEKPFETVLETYRQNIYSGDSIILVFDEIQSIPGWEKWVKAWYDQKKYQVIISGSSAGILDSGLSTYISGRYLRVQVFPLDFSEYLLFQGMDVPAGVIELSQNKYLIIEHLRNYLIHGGFPATVHLSDPDLRKDFLASYYDSIVYRDIAENHNVRNIRVLRELLSYMMTNVSVPFSYRKLGQMLNVDQVVVKDYLSYASDVYLLFEVRSFSYSLKSQSSQNKKGYCIDAGLRNAVSFKFSADEGRLAENLVFLELCRKGFDPYYWKKTHEVDFVVKHKDNSLSAVNVCFSDDLPEREVLGLQEFSDTFLDNVSSRLVITKDTEREQDGILFVPLWKWLLTGSSVV